ncbi:MAG TPA: GNAT family N-acetyltransferase [Candidatus Acidoferrum sp.]|nr:GNAT family N-acetyltransferase [Candidatus Acidoferrum sp.]
MTGFSARRVNELHPRESQAITALLDASPGSSAYQYPYAGDGNEIFFLLERDGQLVFSGRANSGLFASRYLPFLRVLAFNRGPAALTFDDLVAGLQQVRQWARAQGYAALQVMPEIGDEAGAALAQALGERQLSAVGPAVRYTLRLDLTPGEADLMAAFPKDCRYRIRRAHKEGITVRLGETEQDFEDFIAIHREMTGRKQLAQASRPLLQALWQLRREEPTRLALLMAEHSGQLLGANLVFRAGRRAEYLMGAVGKEQAVLHGDVTAGYPLQWSGMQWAKAAGCVDYDMGGYSPVTPTGPAKLKKAFFQQPQPVTLCPAFNMDLMPVVPAAVRLLHKAAKACLAGRHG